MVKADVLAALDAARSKYISGQELAQQLGVSRTAIWKAVAALRADGIPVAAVTNRGYILSPAADVLNAAAVTALLAPEVARALQVEVVDRLPGTNAALRARAENGAPEGLVLIARARPGWAQLLLAPGRAVPQHPAAAGDRPAPGCPPDRYGRRGRMPCR